MQTELFEQVSQFKRVYEHFSHILLILSKYDPFEHAIYSEESW